MWKAILTALIALASLDGYARAEIFPSHPITIVVPFSAGGPSDAMARILAERMKVKLGRVLSVEEEQPVVVAPGRQVELAASGKSGGEAPVVEPGTIEVHASVRLTIEIVEGSGR